MPTHTPVKAIDQLSIVPARRYPHGYPRSPHSLMVPLVDDHAMKEGPPKQSFQSPSCTSWSRGQKLVESMLTCTGIALLWYMMSCASPARARALAISHFEGSREPNSVSGELGRRGDLLERPAHEHGDDSAGSIDDVEEAAKEKRYAVLMLGSFVPL